MRDEEIKIEPPVDSTMEFSGHMLKVMQASLNRDCQRCGINRYFKSGICDKIACSRFERRDRINIIFKEIKPKEDGKKN